MAYPPSSFSTPHQQSIPLRAGVVGVGYLGRFHAQKYARLEGVDLVGVVDSNAARAEEVAQECQTSAQTDYRALFGNVDCVSIAVPTQLHAAVAQDFLAQGIDVLVEKPLTATGAEGRRLVDLAHEHGCILQVGTFGTL